MVWEGRSPPLFTKGAGGLYPPREGTLCNNRHWGRGPSVCCFIAWVGRSSPPFYKGGLGGMRRYGVASFRWQCSSFWPGILPLFREGGPALQARRGLRRLSVWSPPRLLGPRLPQWPLQACPPSRQTKRSTPPDQSSLSRVYGVECGMLRSPTRKGLGCRGILQGCGHGPDGHAWQCSRGRQAQRCSGM